MAKNAKSGTLSKKEEVRAAQSSDKHLDSSPRSKKRKRSKKKKKKQK